MTGLFLTVSSMWLEGRFYSFLNTIHALTVILGLMYIPFGKLFHIFQRPANLGVAYYKRASAERPAAALPALWRGVRVAARRWPTSRRSCPQVGFDYSHRRRRQLPGHLPAVPPAAGHAGPVRSESEGSADGPSTGHRGRARSPATGPTSTRRRRAGGTPGIEIDREVKTHCCFCGQQCGIKLKVHDNEVVGFEPWYEFPFNEGKLCPKGVKRYLQGSHPDRLLEPLERDQSAPGGFRTGHAGTRRSIGSSRRSGASRPSTAPTRSRCCPGCSLDQREELPRRQVRPPRRRHREPRLQRPALHGVGRRGEQEGARHRPRARTRGATSRSPTWCSSPAPTSPRCSRSPRATSGGPATAAPSSSSPTRGSRPSPAPPTCSSGSGPAPTRR